MPSPLLPLTKLDKSTVKNYFKNSPLIFGLGLLCILSLFLQTFTVFIATLSGSLLSLYLVQLKTDTQTDLQRIHSLLLLRSWIALVINCNKQLSNHRNSRLGKGTFSWEPFLDFYNFQTLPPFNVNDITFLLKTKTEGNIHLYESILAFNAHIIILSNALNELQKCHDFYLDKINIWVSKIKTIKALREMNSSDAKILREKMGNNLFQQLTFLTNLCIEKSDSLHSAGPDLLTSLAHYERRL